MSDNPFSGERGSAQDLVSLEAQVFAQFEAEGQASADRVRALNEGPRASAFWPPAPAPFNPRLPGFPGFMFDPLPPPPPPGPSVQSLLGVAEEYGRWLSRCEAYVPAAERLRLAGRPAFSQRLQFVMGDVMGARRIVQGMARDAHATQIELGRIARDAQRDVFVTQQRANEYQQLGFALYNRAFSELQQGLQRIVCPQCRGVSYSALCATCLGAGVVTVSIR